MDAGVGADRVGADRVGAGRVGADRVGADRVGAGWGPEWGLGGVWVGTDGVGWGVGAGWGQTGWGWRQTAVLTRNCVQVTSAPIRIPRGMKNMLATLCTQHNLDWGYGITTQPKAVTLCWI